MRIRFVIIFLVVILSIFLSSMLITYRAVSESYSQLSEELMELSENNPELQQSAAIIRAFSEKRAIELTRESIRPYLLVAALFSALFLAFLFGITRPLHRLARTVEDFKPESPGEFISLKERGAMEIRYLIRSVNRFARQISEYYALIGDTNRFRGWKEISHVIVHEVNNLISPVETYAGFLADKLQDKEREKAGKILLSLNEIKAILSRLRNLSHLPSAQLIPSELVPLIESVAYEFPSASFQIPEKAVEVEIDPVLFKEILRNLIKNAVESGKEVEVRISIIIEEDQYIIRIADNGPGIPQEIKRKLFQPGVSSKPGSLGIGLSVSQSLANEQQMHLTLNEDFNEGSVFDLQIPKKEFSDENIGS